MKTLLLMRHAKADVGEPGMPDIERPLAPRGLKAARRVGRFLAQNHVLPDLVLASTATRARKTAELVYTSGGLTCPVRLLPDFYDATPTLVLRALAREAGTASCVLAVGHEPTWSSLVALLTGAQVHMVTAALAGIELAIDVWPQLDKGPADTRFPALGQLLHFVPPRLLDPWIDP